VKRIRPFTTGRRKGTGSRVENEGPGVENGRRTQEGVIVETAIGCKGDGWRESRWHNGGLALGAEVRRSEQKGAKGERRGLGWIA